MNSKIIYKIYAIGDVNINEQGYAYIGDRIPNINGYSVFDANIDMWLFGTPYNITSNGMYLLGLPSSTVTDVSIRYFLFKND